MAAVCGACGAALPPMFPGARVVCVCGAACEAPVVAASRPPGAPSPRGPYRGGPAPMVDPEPLACTFCGAATPPMSRVCPTCDVRLDRVRCARCFQLQAPGSFACARCGQNLELEALLDLLDAPCPRCSRQLEGSTGEHENIECAGCGGLFVTKAALTEILADAELRGPFAPGDPSPRWSAPPRPMTEVRYLACPICRKSMNRTNFGRVSGVIVDVCTVHGTWFDAGELTRTIEFVAQGGMKKAQARIEEERSAEQRERAALRATSMGAVDFESTREVEHWRDLLTLLFS